MCFPIAMAPKIQVEFSCQHPRQEQSPSTFLATSPAKTPQFLEGPVLPFSACQHGIQLGNGDADTAMATFYIMLSSLCNPEVGRLQTSLWNVLNLCSYFPEQDLIHWTKAKVGQEGKMKRRYILLRKNRCHLPPLHKTYRTRARLGKMEPDPNSVRRRLLHGVWEREEISILQGLLMCFTLRRYCIKCLGQL